jgi:uncharacterized membrane protein
MALLIVAALVWVGVHVGIAGTRLRDAVATRIGEGRFRGLFSLLSILALAFLIWCWGRGATTPLWYAPIWLRWVLVAVMLVAFVLFVASVSDRNPTMIGTDAAPPPRGIQRVTRHPMLWSFALWAAVHSTGNGDSAAIVFFGAFLVTALIGMPSIDAKLARRGSSDLAGAVGRNLHRAVRRNCGGSQPVCSARSAYTHGCSAWCPFSCKRTAHVSAIPEKLMEEGRGDLSQGCQSCTCPQARGHRHQLLVPVLSVGPKSQVPCFERVT